MVIGIPKTAVIGVPATWLTSVDGYTNATHDLLWLLGSTTVQATAQTAPQPGWTTTTTFDWASLGSCAWVLSVREKAAPNTVTEVATGSIFLETPEYNTLRKQLEATDAAITRILEGGANQSVSIKGRSTTKYGLAELRALRSQLNAQLYKMRSGGAADQVLVRF